MTNTNEPTLTPAQQAAAVDRIHENIALRSGAGCGKTFVLARRFTELLLACPDENPLRRFVALTFTEKAAMEMSQRVRAILTDLAARAKGHDRQKIVGWLEEIDQARISTIHSFCSSLLRTYAVQAGVDPNFSVCPDELTVNQMSDDAVEQAILEAVREERQDVAPLLSAMSFESLAKQVSTLLDDRTGWQAGQYAVPEATFKRWQGKLTTVRQKAWQDFERDEKIAASVQQLRTMQCSDHGDKLYEPVSVRLAIIARMLASPAQRTPQAFAAIAESIGRGGSDKAWGYKGSAKAVRDSLKALQAAVEPYAIFTEELGDADMQAAHGLATLTSLAQRAGEIFTSSKRRRGILDFTDLLHYSHRLLAEHVEIRRAIRRQIEQLLIDECQDTDAFQATLLGLAIFADDAVGEQIPEGRLFFVGDAKQSIYRFRGAQVEVFEELCRRLGASKQIGLDLSFRTHQAGVAFANALFAKLMGEDYAPIEAHRTFTPTLERGPTVEILLASPTTGEIKTSSDASKIQAAATAGRIAEMLAGGEKLVWDKAAGSWRSVEARDIAILFARMTTSLDYERELSRRGIPYYVVAGTGFFRQQEVFDILNILQSIDNPFDDLAFFGTLRSAMVGMDDNAMMHIARQLDPPYLPKMIDGNFNLQIANCKLTISGLTESQNLALRFAVDLIGRLHRIKDAVGIDELIRRVLDATGYEAVLLSQFNGRRMLGNIRMIIEQARSSSGMALADFVNQMRRRVMDESRYEQAAVAGEGENVVRIMTIHKAKGLEFPVVFLPDLNVARQKFSASLLNRNDWGLTYKFKPGADEESDTDDDPNDHADDTSDTSVAYRLACREENKDADKEDIRRFYVAVTRHEDHLVLVGADWRTKDGTLRQSGSYIKTLDDALGVSAAIDADLTTLAYGPTGEYVATVRRYTPAEPKYIAKTKSPGETAMEYADCAQDVIDAIPQADVNISADKTFIASPLPLETAGVEIAVTVLGDFAKCPMLYRWRYELLVPKLEVCRDCPGVPPVAMTPQSGSLDAATLGTLLHGCMEHLDFAHPQDALSLAAAQAEEMSLSDSIDLAPIAAEFSQMIAKLQAQPIWAELSSAKQIYRELDFVMELPPATLRGQIDLIYQDSDGQWHIVDYKSDRIGSEGIAPHADRYRQQMLLYSSAAARYMGHPPADATIYFLRTGQVSRLIVTPEMLAESQDEIRQLAHELIACRRSGQFDRRQDRHCEYCQYNSLCGTQGH